MRRDDGRARAQSGGVFLDGCPLPAVQHEFLHKQVSIVSQEPILFAESILYNIAFGARAPPTPSFQGAWSCLRCSHAELVQLEVSQQAAVCAATASGRRAGGGVGRRTPGGGPQSLASAAPAHAVRRRSALQAAALWTSWAAPALSGARAGPQVSKPHSIPLARVEEAAKLANAHDFIQSFPQGYHTQVRRARPAPRAPAGRPIAWLAQRCWMSCWLTMVHDT